MIEEANARLARPSESRHVVHVYDLAIEEVARQRGDTFAVGGQHAPALAGQHFPLALADVQPEETEARHESAVSHAEVAGSAGAEKVKFVVSQEVSSLPIAIDADTDARVLRAETHFGELGGGGVIVGNAAETAADASAGVLVLPIRRGIHEADRHDSDVADLDLQWRRGFRCGSGGPRAGRAAE